MNVNDACRIVIDNFRVMLHIVASLTALTTIEASFMIVICF